MKCKFADAGEVNTCLLEQLIVGSRHKTVQEKLLEKGDQLSSLDEGLEVARTHEATATQMAQLTGSRSASVSPADISFVKKSAPKRSKDFKKKKRVVNSVGRKTMIVQYAQLDQLSVISVRNKGTLLLCAGRSNDRVTLYICAAR